MSKEAVARKPTDAEPFDSTEAGRKCEVTFSLLQVAVEVQRGAVVSFSRVSFGTHAVIHVRFTLGEKSPPTVGLVLDGELYVSALDAGAFRGREKERLLAVARRCANA